MASVALLVEKDREGVPPWAGFDGHPAALSGLFAAVAALADPASAVAAAAPAAVWPHERATLLAFTNLAFASLEHPGVRPHALRLVGLPLWRSLSPGRLELELAQLPALARPWKRLAKKDAKALAAGEPDPASRPESAFLPALVREWLAGLREAGADGRGGPAGAPPTGRGSLIRYLETGAELWCDLLSQLPTRRFVRTLLADFNLLLKARRSALVSGGVGGPGATLAAQVDLLSSYDAFPLDDHTGDPRSDDDALAVSYAHAAAFQRLVFKFYAESNPAMREVALAPCSFVTDPAALGPALLAALEPPALARLATAQLRCVRPDDAEVDDPAFLAAAIAARLAAPPPAAGAVASMPLYPTEAVLWNPAAGPPLDARGAGASADATAPLALPKLNLQFLAPRDYLARNFHLYRLEAAAEVREDVGAALARLQPARDEGGEWGGEGACANGQPRTIFRGWARAATPVRGFAITEVAPPRLGEARPARVTADLALDTAGMRPDVAGEWDGLRAHDVIFLMTVRAPADAGAAASDASLTPDRRYGLAYIRGAEILEVRDAAGRLMNDFSGRTRREDGPPRPAGTTRTLSLALDTAQYQADMEAMEAAAAAAGNDASAVPPEDVYATFNVVLRRPAKENNFKAVLECVRDLVVEAGGGAGPGAAAASLPPWLADVILGYGDPAAASWTALPRVDGPSGHLATVDFADTFLDAAHVAEAFPGYEVRWTDAGGAPLPAGAPLPPPPYRITFPPSAFASSGGDGEGGDPAPGHGCAGAGSANQPKPVLLAAPHARPAHPGPYLPPPDAPRNTVRFTPTQVAAITAGVQPGLTLVVGPPGTGKTDTAVQAIALLHANRPHSRTLLVTHSNAALNDLFAKLVERGMPPRRLLRLGAGEVELDAAGVDYSRAGRVNAALARRLELLAEVERLARHAGVAPPGGLAAATTTDGEGGSVSAATAAYTCETAAHFWLRHVLAPWERYQAALRSARAAPGGLTSRAVREGFPFSAYFADAIAAGRVFAGEEDGGDDPAAAAEADAAGAAACFAHLRSLFVEVEELRPFEILRGSADRTHYLMTHVAKVVAMTATHAALKRADFLAGGFAYDTVVMEEAAQVLEVESFIPLVLQRHGPVAGAGGAGAAADAAVASSSSSQPPPSRLARVLLIGDHHQLPPVVQCAPLARGCRLDQPLFTRLVRLGTPAITLDAQGRARPGIAALYNWRYGGAAAKAQAGGGEEETEGGGGGGKAGGAAVFPPPTPPPPALLAALPGAAAAAAPDAAPAGLADLPRVDPGSGHAAPEYAAANAGMVFDYQFVDVPDYNGVGESTPSPHYYQNLGEAELVVSTYQYLRLRGWPAARIALLTTYNGQRDLLADVIEARCAGHPAFGRPGALSTVDKFQGQQADVVLLSLVRTRAVGHVRDVRRLVVALSRARLGLYVFGRAALFSQCYELAPAMARLLARPTAAPCLVPSEEWGRVTRRAGETLEGGDSRRVDPAGPAEFAAVVAGLAAQWEAAARGAWAAGSAAAGAGGGGAPAVVVEEEAPAAAAQGDAPADMEAE